MMQNRTAALCFIFLTSIVFPACKTEKLTITTTPANSKPEYGDMYVASSIGDASYLNPLLATDTASGNIASLVFNGLLKYDKDLQITGDLAASWEVKRGGLEISFALRKGIKWHDGRDFTADDVKFTYEKLIDPNVKTPYGSDFALVKKVVAVNPYKIDVYYSVPFAPCLESWMMGIVPKHIFEKGDFNTNSANRKPIGTGPFKFVEWKTDEKIVLEANPDYFEGKPYISRYVFRIVPDQSVEFFELRNESIDEMNLTPDQWRAYPEFFLKYNKFRYPSFQYTYLGLNQKSSLFSDKRIRVALAHAINKDELIDGVLLGMGKKATGPFVPQSWAYNPQVEDYKYDPALAEKILADLGWKRWASGYFAKDSKVFEFTIITNQGNKLRSATAEILQSQLKKAGIKANVRILEWSAMLHQFIDKRNFDAVLMGWSLGRDPDQYLIWNSEQIKESQYNFVNYNNPAVDKLLNDGRRTFDQKKRGEIYRIIHKHIAEDLPYIFLYYPESLPVVHKRFQGPEVSPAGLGWNFHKWWVAKENIKYKISQ